MMSLWTDLRYAWRLLIKAPGYSLLCTTIVALGVGLAVWADAIAYTQALKPLPFRGADRWYSLQAASDAKAIPTPALDAYTYQEVVKSSRNANFLGAFASRAAVLSEGQASTSLRAAAISPSLLSAMQVAPMGRLFDSADSLAGATPAAILSFDTWHNYFAADPGIVGKQARIDGHPVQIIGVMPKDFYAFQDFELWFPLQLDNLPKPAASDIKLSPLIALGKDQNLEAILTEMKATVDKVNRGYPELFSAARHVVLVPAHRMFTHQLMQVLSMVSFIAVAVLLLACVNISLIFLARLLERSRELALRTALGSTRWRLMRQCLLESVLIVLFGLLLGYCLAVLGIHWAQSLGEFTAQMQASGRPPNPVFLRSVDFVAAVGAATVLWLLSTLIPAWRITKQDAATVLAGSGKGVATLGSARGVGILVGLQVVVSCLVLIICGNLVFAVRAEAAKPMGLDPARVMMSTYPTVFDGRYAQASERIRYWDDLTANIKQRLTGAEVSFATAVPTRPVSVPIAIESQEGTAHQGILTLPFVTVSENYFDLLGIKILSGRRFDSTDNETSTGVTIIDENMAKRYWPGQDAIGKRIQLSPTEGGPFLTVVGVVSNVVWPYSRDIGTFYRPLRQATPEAFFLAVKMANPTSDSRATVRAAAFAVNRDLPLHNLQMLDQYLRALNQTYTSVIPVFIVISAITVILAATGLFGLISRSVARRTQEVGVRRALGGTQWQVTVIFLRQGLVYLSVGVVGVCLGVLVTNALSVSVPNILIHVGQVTPGVFLLVALVVFVASFLPTRRAVALEPGDALRYE
jgi:putative ABC transport system permease protein